MPKQQQIRHTGIIKFFNPEKGFGFIESHTVPNYDEDIFVHVKGLDVQPHELTEGTEVTFVAEASQKYKGKLTAERVQLG